VHKIGLRIVCFRRVTERCILNIDFCTAFVSRLAVLNHVATLASFLGCRELQLPGTRIAKETRRVNMADVANKYPQNVTGRFYVDDQCIDCDLCRETAPANFTRDDDGGHSYVYKQPESPEEEALCKEAMEGCPVEAIGPDGE
jgi:ferredoxin